MRRLENADEDKFWEAWIKNDTILVYRYGKIGSSGHTKLKKYKTLAEAEAGLEEMLQAKLAEGFEEAGAEGGEDEESEEAAPKKAPAKKAAASDDEDEESEDEDESEDEESEDEDESEDEEESDDEESEDEEESDDEDEDKSDDEDEEESEDEESEDEDKSDDEDEEESDDEDEEESDDEDEEESDDEESEDEEESDDEDEEESDDEDEEESDDEDEDEDEEEERPRRGAAKKAAAPPPPPPPPPEPPKPKFPPRTLVKSPKKAEVTKARDGLEALRKGLGKRSWQVAGLVRKARRGLGPIAGYDPADEPTFAASFDGVMAAVFAPKARLPLEDAMALIAELAPEALGRAVGTWKGKKGVAAPTVAALAAVDKSVEDGELKLYVARLVSNRRMSRPAFRTLWARIAPLLAEAKSKVADQLQKVDADADPILRDRIADAAPSST